MKAWEKNIRKVTPYVPGEQPQKENMIKLNTNENHYPPSKKVEEIKNKMDMEIFRLYPDSNVTPLVKALSKYHNIKEDQIFVGVGSDDVLAMSFMTYFNSDKPILFPDITYSFYDVWAKMLGIPYVQLPLNDSFEIVKEDYFRENGGIVIANPNAPTSIALGVDKIEEIVAANQESVVIVDEAYVDFGAQSCLPLIEKYDNLLVVRTFSKSRSLAGMRIGYAMGNAALIAALNDVKQSFNSYTMNQTAIAFGVASVEDNAYFKESVQKIISTREWFSREMKELGFHFGDSKANFLFVTHETASAKDIFEAAKQKDIFFRFFDKPRINNYLRITIGTDEQMQKVIAFLKEYLKK